MVRGRRVGRLRSAVYDINQMRVSQEHESVELKKHESRRVHDEVYKQVK